MREMNEHRLKVVLAENLETSDGSVKHILEERKAILFSCSDGVAAIRAAFSKGPDLIILDTDLPRMNGYQCSRVLKREALTREIPILHTGTAPTPLDRYWSKVCQADGYVPVPADEDVLEAAIQTSLRRDGPLRRRLPKASIIPGLDDGEILGLATHLLEHDLLMSSILNEINQIDDWSLSSKDLMASLFAIIHSLFPFSGGAGLLIFENHSEFHLCPCGGRSKEFPKRMLSLICDHLGDRHGLFLKFEDVSTILLDPLPEAIPASDSGDVFVHTLPRGPVRSVIAFENINHDALPRDEQDVFQLAVEMAHGMMEKKIFSIMAQELSIIDQNTRGYSMAFFMEVLARELANAQRNHYPITLFTLFISNYGELIADQSPEDRAELLKIVHSAILKTMRKSDFVARWAQANFVFLLTYTSRENAGIPAARVKAKILEDVAAACPDLGPLVVSMGVSELDPGRPLTPEAFLNEAVPKKSPPPNGNSTSNEQRPVGGIG